MRTHTHSIARVSRLAPLAAAIFLAGCGADLVVPDFNNPSIEDLSGSPTPTKIATAAQGLLIGTRVQQGEQNGYVSLLGILGRESYNFDPADPRFIFSLNCGFSATGEGLSVLARKLRLP